ncbi:MAG: hypothetical protein ACK5PF_07300 [bacterium]
MATRDTPCEARPCTSAATSARAVLRACASLAPAARKAAVARVSSSAREIIRAPGDGSAQALSMRLKLHRAARRRIARL